MTPATGLGDLAGLVTGEPLGVRVVENAEGEGEACAAGLGLEPQAVASTASTPMICTVFIFLLDVTTRQLVPFGPRTASG